MAPPLSSGNGLGFNARSAGLTELILCLRLPFKHFESQLALKLSTSATIIWQYYHLCGRASRNCDMAYQNSRALPTCKTCLSSLACLGLSAHLQVVVCWPLAGLSIACRGSCGCHVAASQNLKVTDTNSPGYIVHSLQALQALQASHHFLQIFLSLRTRRGVCNQLAAQAEVALRSHSAPLLDFIGCFGACRQRVSGPCKCTGALSCLCAPGPSPKKATDATMVIPIAAAPTTQMGASTEPAEPCRSSNSYLAAFSRCLCPG